jgi:hypothetical protein
MSASNGHNDHEPSSAGFGVASRLTIQPFEEQTMSRDFVPAFVSNAILAEDFQGAATLATESAAQCGRRLTSTVDAGRRLRQPPRRRNHNCGLAAPPSTARHFDLTDGT